MEPIYSGKVKYINPALWCYLILANMIHQNTVCLQTLGTLCRSHGEFVIKFKLSFPKYKIFKPLLRPLFSKDNQKGQCNWSLFVKSHSKFDAFQSSTAKSGQYQ